MLVGVVDDDGGMRESLASLLEAHGYRVRLFESAEDLIADGRVLDEAGALVIDQNLPGMLGTGLIRQLAGRTINTVLISAQLSARMVAEAHAAGAVAALEKPLDVAQLLAAITTPP